jgi:hypothetical protein
MMRNSEGWVRGLKLRNQLRCAVRNPIATSLNKNQAQRVSGRKRSLRRIDLAPHKLVEKDSAQ